ncbi:aminotransferase class I/II-fold pyridoxal phosphate-dependent enzyme, partial [Planctomycetota bacterium]
TIAVTSRAQELKSQGVDVVGFGAGAPDFDTPDYIKDAAIASLKAGQTKYTPAAGIPQLRAAIAEKLRKENGLDYSPDQVIVNIGGKHSVYEAMQAVLDPGDEVIMGTPYWVTYPETIKLAEGMARVIQTDIYDFDPNQSTVVKTGGFAGIHEAYSVVGRFLLSIDLDANEASFEKVDANLIDEGGSHYSENLGTIFNMTALLGTVIDERTVQFEGKTDDGTKSDILLTLTLNDDSAHLTGTTTPPANSADLFFFELDAIVSRKYSGGTGLPKNPYLIETTEQMNALSVEPDDWDKHFKLIADVNLSDYAYDAALIAPVTISDINNSLEGTPFTGVFDGNGHMIFNLTVIGESYLGMFGRVTSKARIEDLGVVDVNIVGSGDYVGGLVGLNEYGEVARCFSTGRVSGGVGVGGLVGYNDYGGRVVRGYGITTVIGKKDVGGLVGLNYGNVDRCYSAGAVGAGSGLGIGGLVGYGGTVTQSFWDIETSGQIASKGGEGRTTAEMQTAATFLKAGWDFVDEIDNGIEDIWWIDEGIDYPRLTWELAE